MQESWRVGERTQHKRASKQRLNFVTKGSSSEYPLTLTDPDVEKVRVQISQFLCDGFAIAHHKIHPSIGGPFPLSCSASTQCIVQQPHSRCCHHPRSCGCSLAPMSSLTLLDYIVAWRARYLISFSAVQMICHIERYLAQPPCHARELSFRSSAKTYLWTSVIMKESDRAHSQIIFPT